MLGKRYDDCTSGVFLMLTFLVAGLLGCTHGRTTFPLTPKAGPPGLRAGGVTYVTCLDCGREFAYDWETMRRGEAISAHQTDPELRQVDPSAKPAFRHG